MGSTMIDIKYLQQLVEIFDASSVNDLRIEQEGVEIRLSKSPKQEPQQMMPPGYYQQMPQMMAPQQVAAPAGPALSAATASASDASSEENSKKYHEIRSPIVGTFYRSGTPDDPPFVEPGQSVSPGGTLCIIEAMKLMNEIECDSYGKVAKILVENAQPVEYNQLLFLIEQE